MFVALLGFGYFEGSRLCFCYFTHHFLLFVFEQSDSVVDLELVLFDLLQTLFFVDHMFDLVVSLRFAI